MDPRFFRKYADLVESAEKDLPVQQLNEGMLDSLVNWAKNKIQGLADKASPEEKQAIVQMVTQASGGQKPTLNLSTIKNVAAQLKPVAAGIKQKADQVKQQQGQAQQGQAQTQPGQAPATNEGWKDTFAKWGGKAALAGGAAAGYAADKVGDAASAVGHAAAADVSARFADGQLMNIMQWEVAKMAASSQASFNLDLATYALAALCVCLVIYSWLHGQGDFPGVSWKGK